MTIRKYYRKAAMLEAAEKLDNDPDLYVTYLDETEKYRFTYFKNHAKLFKKIEQLEVKNRYYVNEIILNGQKRKPYLDLEKVYPDKKTMMEKFSPTIKKLQKDIIEVFQTEYKQQITINDILLLDSSGKTKDGYKMSLHIIVSPKNKTFYYTSSKFTNSSAFHLFTSLISLDPEYKEILDDQVYNTDVNFRIIGSYKRFDDHRYLRPIDPKTFETIDLNQIKPVNIDNSLDDNDESNDDSDNNDDNSDSNESESEEETFEELEYLLTCMKQITKKLVTPIIEQSTMSKKLVIKNGGPARTDVNKHLIECVRKYHPSVILKFDTKGKVIVDIYKDIFYRFDYEKRNEQCPISGKIHAGSNGFYVFENERGYYMKCFSTNCKGSKHIGYADMVDDFIDHAHQINQRYLIMGPKIADNDEPVCRYIKEWLGNKIKTLAVKSPMATGKTTMVEKILQHDKSIKKILWITHRQTLTKQIYGKFKNAKFYNYMDVKGSLKSYDRIIVQIDSLERIKEYHDGDITYNIYDLVIVDEVEGNMNHYASPFLNKSGKCARYLFKFMLECIYFAKKLLVIDADIGMRTKLFIDHVGESIIVNNNYKPLKKCFVVTNDEITFESSLMLDIGNKLNVCIVSMSANALEKIEVKLKQQNVKYIMHTSRTDDKLKNELEDVGKFWVNYQAVLYSPTIESGVDFNEDHFDKIYCIIRNGQMTCSQRAFLQMVGRIRQIRDPTILCYYDGPCKLNAMVYTYDDTLSYFRYYESINGKKILEDVEYETDVVDGQVVSKRKNKDISLFDHISIYNEVEQLNKHPKIFLTVLNKLIQRGGHELKIDMEEKAKHIKNETEKIEQVLANIDETEYDLQKLLVKQKENKLIDREKLVLKKMFFNKTFGIKNTKNKEDFVKFFREFSKEEPVLRKTEKLFRHKSIYDGNEIDNFNDGKDKARHNTVFDIVDKLLEQNKKVYQYDELIDINIDNAQYNRAINDIAKNSIYFKDEQKNRPLFFKPKGKINHVDDKNNIYYMKIIKSILGQYGIIFTANGQKRDNETKKYVYLLSVDKRIKEIIEFKHKKINKIDIYKNLFDEPKK